MGRSFEDLKVWNKSIELAVLVYQFTTSFPREEVYGLTSQMRRAAVSIASNIAEGSARGTRRDFRQFVKLAQGSNGELQTQLILSDRLNYGKPEDCAALRGLSNEIGRMLSSLSKYLTEQIKSGQISADDN